ncbi:ubiquinone biosynthesis protein UbiH [Marinobacter halodurans]|uniref:Ubiquinone biosynthesis protein UbiH n=1 Tax=Marinobacter halodurans TaxID=2528979 RepID=A0ABY1ZT51_9GAMM|nr:FAD-dependent oxidoreductase [Marinobacter halodurans]TBW58769.1 ubiquinone biosynthesis protein UbiH [Marinobacter halodurans]
MTQTFDVIIVGAGMVGAALANGLGRAGLSVALLDRQEPAPFDPASEPDLRVSALSAGSEAYLERLGAWPLIRGMRAVPYRRLSVWDAASHPLSRLLPAGVARTTFEAAPLGRDHLGHIVENRITQRALWERAGECERIRRITTDNIAAVASDERRVTVTLADSQALQAELLVGADGAQSRIRQLAGIGTTRDQYAQQALVASVRYAGPQQDITWQAFHPSGPRAFLPLHREGEHSWASLVWYDDPARLAALKQLPDVDFLAAVTRAFPTDLPPLTAVAGRASFPLARQHAKHYSADRTVLVGDAAHTINPLAGQGVNLGFQDAQALQEELVGARRAGRPLATPELLARYENRRRPANRRMMLAMDLFYHAFSNRLPPIHLARNLGLALANHLPFAKHQVARYAMGIDDTLPPLLQQLVDQAPRPAFLK